MLKKNTSFRANPKSRLVGLELNLMSFEASVGLAQTWFELFIFAKINDKAN